MIVNFFDNNISNALSYDDALESGRDSGKIVYSREYNSENVNVFSDSNISRVMEFPNSKNVAWIMEPIHYNQRPYDWVSKNHKSFDLILTHNLDLIERIDNGAYMPADGIFLDTPSIEKKSTKLKMCSHIYSDKRMLQGHRLRHEVADVIRSSGLHVDFYGTGCKKIELKSDALNDYFFSIAIENSRSRGYFTEKILDCFATRSVPIYWGDSHVWNFFDKAGAITFDSVNEIPGIINSLSIEKYQSMQHAIEKNWKTSVDEYYSIDSWVAKSIKDCIEV